MPRVANECEQADVRRLLAGAAKTIVDARYCWLATTAENGGTNVGG
jgi:hypothetical protein